MLTFRGFLWVCFFLISIPLDAWAQNTSRQDYVVDWINAEISKSDYESRFADRICETRYQANEPVTTCTYKLRDGAYAEMSENTDKLFSFILTVSLVGEEFDQTEREAMYLFSLFIWGTMPKSSSYDEANAVLRDLYKLSFEKEVAEVNSGNFSFGISELHGKGCPFPVLVLAAQDARSDLGADDVISAIKGYGCAVVAGQLSPSTAP